MKESNKKIYILGIESSCDETAASVVLNGRIILSNIISSQINIHEKYGGVVPEIASRNHILNISQVVDAALSEAKLNLDEISAVAVTYGPGLVGALLVGMTYAKGLSFATGKKLIGVNHIEGHIFANFIQHENLEPPIVCLVVSGGHTHLVYMKDYLSFEILGKTMDDAAGEAYDKIARALGLGYPGGPKIELIAKSGNSNAIKFPRAMQNNMNFSFSGLKSAVLNHINKSRISNQPINNADIAASFQQSIIDVLVQKAHEACELTGVKVLTLSGGVACNMALRSALKEMAAKDHLDFYAPSPILCTDNAAMIASRAYYDYINNINHDISLNAVPGLKIGKKY